MNGIDGPSNGLQPHARIQSDVGGTGAPAKDRQSMDKDRTGAGGREQPGGKLGRERDDRNANAQRESFQAAIAKNNAARPAEQQTSQSRENATSNPAELALILPSATTAGSTHSSAPVPNNALAAERVAALEALAMKIEGELDVALRVSARAVGGGLEVRLAMDSGKLGFSGVTVTLRGAELSVQLTATPNVNDPSLAASAQALAASLSNRFPQRVIRVERVSGAQTDEPAAPPTISDIFARRC